MFSSISPEQKALNSEKTVVVGMSGGVDSSVAAALLKEQGYRVVGMFMKNWEEKDENGVCTSAQDSRDAERVCEQLDIPFYAVEFVQEYWDNVFKNFLEEYQAGFTPNPDILCNREIKFNVFLKKALSIGGDFLATGHYARNEIVAGEHALVKGDDPAKDQSYFLYTLNKETLGKVLFPVGQIEKTKVREIARHYGLPTHAKKDSTGICFIGERNFRDFLSQYLQAKPGDIRLLDGTKVGTHRGAAYYTLGQRKGLGLGGQGESWFVVAKDPKRNIVFAERGELHPALYSDYLIASDLSWVAGAAPLEAGLSGSDEPSGAQARQPVVFRCRAKARYRQKDQDCEVRFDESGRLRVEFDQPQRALTPGQSVVFYDGDVCLGGGIIREVGPNYWEQGKALPASMTVSHQPEMSGVLKD